jgi:hypothetical protein
MSDKGKPDGASQPVTASAGKATGKQTTAAEGTAVTQPASHSTFQAVPGVSGNTQPPADGRPIEREERDVPIDEG